MSLREQLPYSAEHILRPLLLWFYGAKDSSVLVLDIIGIEFGS